MRPLQTTSVLLTIGWLVTAAAAKQHNIFERASTCADPKNIQCTQAGLPSNFCCGASSECIVLAANTTVLCCPPGSSCSTIKSIGCDISLQNASANADISLMTTALTATLPTCGNQCCPFGYSCDSNSNCVQDANQDTAPTTSSTSASTPSASSSTTGASTSVTPVTNESPQDTASCNKFPITALLVGFFPGLVLGTLLAAASICLLGARGRRKAARRRQSGSSFGNISDPQPQSDMRTDFLRKQPETPSTVSSNLSRQPTVQRVRSLFRKSSATASLRQGPGSAPPVPELPALRMSTFDGNTRPVTPALQREPSYENIDIFADGDTASALREREKRSESQRMTTFSDMMEKSGLAGLQKGQPYVYRGSPEYPSSSRTLTPRGKDDR